MRCLRSRRPQVRILPGVLITFFFFIVQISETQCRIVRRCVNIASYINLTVGCSINTIGFISATECRLLWFREQELPASLAGNAVETVARVTGSEIWKRAAACEKRFIEVPYQVPDKKNPNKIERGVIDLAFRENGGWVIVDYKTDSVMEESASHRAEEYAPQLAAYAEAWRKALGEPVSEIGLYFTIVDKYIKLK
ncbi:MAG: hypothetical protein E3J72_15540 [Planctomycetota bacterium]|nr:MAG: hypothetical protein E3J72_15540 [Planctomycetota bacterium]